MLVYQIDNNLAVAGGPSARSDAYLAPHNHFDGLAAGVASSGFGTQFATALGPFVNA